MIGVDAVPPRGDIGDVSFVRADIRNPVIAKVIAKEDVDTVVHMSVIATPGSAGGRGTMKELNVIGTMQLLAACQKAPSVRHLVVKSTLDGVRRQQPRPGHVHRGDGAAPRSPRSGYAKDVAEIEGYVRGFARRRPDVRVTTLRLANVLGPHVAQPDHVVLPAAGDPDRARLRPAAAVPARAATCMRVLAHARPHRGARHVQRRRRRHHACCPRPYAGSAGPPSPLPGFAVGGSASVLRSRPGWPTSRPSSSAFLTYGRGMDTTRMRADARLRAGVHHRSRPSPTSPPSIGRPASPVERVVDGARVAPCPIPRPTGAGRG